MNNPRPVLLSFLAVALVLGLTAQAGTSSGLTQFAVPDTQWFGLLPTSSFVGVAVFAVSMLALVRSAKATQFADEVAGELRRVAWPTKEETTRATTTVIGSTVFMAVLLASFDFLWKALTDWLMAVGA